MANWMGLWVMSPVITARSPLDSTTTEWWPGVWPGVGSRRTSPVRRWSALDQVDQARLPDREHRVAHHLAEGGGVLVVLPELELDPAEQVAGLGERRAPTAVDQPRVPADVVDVEVGADDGVDAERVGNPASSRSSRNGV